MPTYTADDGTTISWDEPAGPATITTADGETLVVSFGALAGVFDAATAALLGHFSAKDRAANLWAHDLKGGLTGLLGAACLVERYLARGDPDRAAEKARLVRQLARARVAIIERGRQSVLDA